MTANGYNEPEGGTPVKRHRVVPREGCPIPRDFMFRDLTEGPFWYPANILPAGSTMPIQPRWDDPQTRDTTDSPSRSGD